MKELALLLLFVAHVNSWNEGKVLLREVQALTLHRGRYTTARRSSPVPQLQCLGGSAGCSAFIPETVQCQNKGWDGVDVQWECKTDMDNAYRFGKVEVSCEGYDHPNDPYILTGSCGLEFTLELTKEGRSSSYQGHHHGGHQGSWSKSQGGGWSKGFSTLGNLASSFFTGSSFFSSGHHGNRQQQYQHQHQAAPSDQGGGSLLVVAFLLLLAYGVYKLFLSGPSAMAGNDQPDGYQGDGTQPPPPGFRPDFMGSSSTGYPGSAGYHSNPGYGFQSNPGYQGASPGYGFHSDYTRQHYPGGRAGGGGGGGFWTGMGTGGVLGYLFGSQRNQHQPNFFSNTSYSQPRTSPPASPQPPSSTGTRTASGFGGTKRR